MTITHAELMRTKVPNSVGERPRARMSVVRKFPPLAISWYTIANAEPN